MDQVVMIFHCPAIFNVTAHPKESPARCVHRSGLHQAIPNIEIPRVFTLLTYLVFGLEKCIRMIWVTVRSSVGFPILTSLASVARITSLKRFQGSLDLSCHPACKTDSPHV
jgi:hypothetical protein